MNAGEDQPKKFDKKRQEVFYPWSSGPLFSKPEYFNALFPAIEYFLSFFYQIFWLIFPGIHICISWSADTGIVSFSFDRKFNSLSFLFLPFGSIKASFHSALFLFASRNQEWSSPHIGSCHHYPSHILPLNRH